MDATGNTVSDSPTLSSLQISDDSLDLEFLMQKQYVWYATVVSIT